MVLPGIVRTEFVTPSMVMYSVLENVLGVGGVVEVSRGRILSVGVGSGMGVEGMATAKAAVTNKSIEKSMLTNEIQKNASNIESCPCLTLNNLPFLYPKGIPILATHLASLGLIPLRFLSALPPQKQAYASLRGLIQSPSRPTRFQGCRERGDLL